MVNTCTGYSQLCCETATLYPWVGLSSVEDLFELPEWPSDQHSEEGSWHKSDRAGQEYT